MASVVVQLALLRRQRAKLGQDLKALDHLGQPLKATLRHSIHIGARALLPIEVCLVALRFEEGEDLPHLVASGELSKTDGYDLGGGYHHHRTIFLAAHADEGKPLTRHLL